MAENGGTLAKSISQSKFLSCRVERQTRRQEGDNMLAHFVLSSQAPQSFSNLSKLFGTLKTGQKFQQTSADFFFGTSKVAFANSSQKTV